MDFLHPPSHFLSPEHPLQWPCVSKCSRWHGTPAGIKSIKGLVLGYMCLFGRRWYTVQPR